VHQPNPTRELAFIYSDEMGSLRYPPDCPFRLDRIPMTRHRLSSLGLLSGNHVKIVAPQPASNADLARHHDSSYLAELRKAVTGDLTPTGLLMGLGTVDTPVFHDLYRAGAMAAGATLAAADLVIYGKAHFVFSPFGGFHHAMKARANGFCYVNDVALGCIRLTDAGKRVLFLDVDAHHGDGVQEAFYDRRDVLTISIHETGKTLYPWSGFESETGTGPGIGYNVNLPVPADTYNEAYLALFHAIVVPLTNAFDPDIIVVELGMDALAGDPLTHLRLTNDAHVDILRSLMSRGKPIVCVGGGGYNVHNTVRGWARAWQTLCGMDDNDDWTLGLGGVMLGSTEWSGGLRDPSLPVTPEQRQTVLPEIHQTIRAIRQTVFPIHGLSSATTNTTG
jgi:acetoin utilization protein AcuC